MVVLEFSDYISDNEGFDFAVFENSFSETFLELAFVEVSSDGINFFRFPSTSLTDSSSNVGTFGNLEATNLNNLAGKYSAGYGTPFDLAELPDTSLLNKQAIQYVKIIDVIGTNSVYGSFDSNGNKIIDPFPTLHGGGSRCMLRELLLSPVICPKASEETPSSATARRGETVGWQMPTS